MYVRISHILIVEHASDRVIFFFRNSPSAKRAANMHGHAHRREAVPFE